MMRSRHSTWLREKRNERHIGETKRERERGVRLLGVGIVVDFKGVKHLTGGVL